MLPVLHIDEEALRPRIEQAKRQSFAARRTSSLQDDQQRRNSLSKPTTASLVRCHSSDQPSEVSSRLGMRCASCGEAVFLAERLVVSRSAYHRSCFRCARCHHQLTPGNYYETEAGQYCCEACPADDEHDFDRHARSTPLDSPPESPPASPPPSPSPTPTPVSQPTPSRREPASPEPTSTTTSPEATAALLEAPLSDEEKRLQLRSAALENEHDFDQMIRQIEHRIAQLGSPEATRSRVHSVPDVERSGPSETNLRRSNSLGLVSSDHTKDRPPRRRLSLGLARPSAEPPEPPEVREPPTDEAPRALEPSAEDDYPDDLNPFADEEPQQQSGNPFSGDEDEEREEDLPPKPMARTKSKRRLLEAPRINLNPFWSDEEAEPPVPRPRSLRPHTNLLGGGSLHSSNASIASSCSTLTPGGTYRKKKPAPAPPSSTDTSPSVPRLTPRTRKAKPAPPPPLPMSPPPPPPPPPPQTTTDNDKLSKDEANRNTQSLLDKSLEGKWKRKKGPAPARPTPLRRKIKVMSMKDVKLELDQIEMQQQGLERQGVRLEQIIRDRCESNTACEETSLGLDVEELVLELFALVNEKNELFRRQAELMLLRRQQRLEEEHADIEYQVRCLITQPEATKTDFDKQREETLIQRLVEIVEKRNEIVECLEMDRRREIEEDRSIHREMDLYAARNKGENVNVTDESRRTLSKLKKGKFKEKVKEKKSKKTNKKDADKDVDESEAKLKRLTLRKWF